MLRNSSSRGSSRPVFDSRKAMAGKRKVSTNLGSLVLCVAVMLSYLHALLSLGGFVVAQTVINALSVAFHTKAFCQ